MMPVTSTSSRAIFLNTASSTLRDSHIPRVAPMNMIGTITADDRRRSAVIRSPNT